MKHTPKLARTRGNSKSTKFFGLNVMTLEHWVSQLWPYSTGFSSYDLFAWRCRFGFRTATVNSDNQKQASCDNRTGWTQHLEVSHFCDDVFRDA